jgi:hypothetical protein
MDAVEFIDIVHFIEICRYLDVKPVPQAEMVEVKSRPHMSTPSPGSRTIQPQTVDELTGMLDSIANR